MEISKDVFNSVFNTVSAFVKGLNNELEIKYAGKNVVITRDQFSHTLNYFRSQGYTEKEHTEALDVHFMYNGYPYRISLTGKENIQSYCLTNKITSNMVKEAISKRIVNNFRTIFIPDFNVRIDLREEVPVGDIVLNELLMYLENVPKGFRYKKRYSYTNKGTPMRYDFTIIKRSHVNHDEFLCHKRFSTSNILSNHEFYELEIEAMKNIQNVEKFTKDFLKAGVNLYAIVNGIHNVISNRTKTDVLAEYLKILEKLTGKKVLPVQQVLDRPRGFLIGPQPVTLELKSLASDAMKINTILEDYTVTEKADGERQLMFVNSEGSVYLINSKMNVFSLDVQLSTVSNCLLDGEYITKDADGGSIRIFAIFDVYLYDGVDVSKLPLVSDVSGNESRSKKMNDFCDRYKDKFAKDIIIHAKKFYHGSNIFGEVTDIMNMVKSNSFIYRIDGLIFTPKYLPVGGIYKGNKSVLQGPWVKVLKWKPPQENTIDMQVKENGKSNLTVVDGKMMKVFNLCIGYKPSAWEPIKPKAFLEKKFRPDTRYTVIPFAPITVQDRNVSMFYGDIDTYGATRCKNGDEITNNAIIEFAYINDPTIPFPLRWKPLRVRRDKVSPNDFSSAMNVWRSIEIPVSEEMITGIRVVSIKDYPEEDVYYKRNIARDQFASVNMMDFHNYWNKFKFLLEKYAKPNNSLFDIACGQGGDLKRWIACGLRDVYGVDKVRDNIENPDGGMYSRLSKVNFNGIQNPEYVFGTMDSSKVITESYVKSLRNIDDIYVGEKLLKHEPFDIVSCQFAIHYFFESEEILDRFLKNVSNFLKIGGYFIGTCLDGYRVKKLLTGVQTKTGKNDDRFMWNISKLYNSSDNAPPTFGEQIKVYMESIGIEIPEYLVNTSILIEKLKKYNIEPIEISSFEETYKEVINMKEEEGYYFDAVRSMTDIEKEYSFLNIRFAFQKKETISKSSTSKLDHSIAISEVDALPKKKKVVIKKST